MGQWVALPLALKARCGTRGRCLLSRDDMNDRRAEGSVVRTGEAWTCAHHYFVFVGATEPESKNQETRMDPEGVPVYWSHEF